jgi:hypothetical protein
MTHHETLAGLDTGAIPHKALTERQDVAMRSASVNATGHTEHMACKLVETVDSTASLMGFPVVAVAPDPEVATNDRRATGLVVRSGD